MRIMRTMSFMAIIAKIVKMRVSQPELACERKNTINKAVTLGCTLLTCTGLIVAQDSPDNAQLAKLYQLQAAFHRTMSVQDPENGDSPDVITQRIRDMLSLWTSDGQFVLAVNGPKDGNYIGTGDPTDDSTCPAPSTNPQNRGTLCTLFKYVSAPFQPANRFVSLAPSYKTTFSIHGATATGHFECHFFNVAINPNTGLPLWAPVQHLGADMLARNEGGQWRFSYLIVSPTGIPVGSTMVLSANVHAIGSNLLPAC